MHDNQVGVQGRSPVQLDRARYEIALQQALATVARQRASLAEADAKRIVTIVSEVVSSSARTESHSGARGHRGASARLADLAQRGESSATLVVAPVNGISTTWRSTLIVSGGRSGG